MSARKPERCPACNSGMFPGDVVCRACERRVRGVRPDLLGDYANRDITDVPRGFYLRGQIVGFALRLAPTRGRPPIQNGKLKAES